MRPPLQRDDQPTVVVDRAPSVQTSAASDSATAALLRVDITQLWTQDELCDIESVVTWARVHSRSPPNVDINGDNVTVHSVTHALDLLRHAQHAWASFDATDAIRHPSRFLLASAPVAGYSNVLLTIGEGVGIGMHVDTAVRDRRRCDIDTWIAVVNGCKSVVLAPPGVTQFDHEWVDDGRKAQLLQLGGFVFQLGKGDVLLVPRRWRHWIKASAPYSIALTGSRW